MTEPELIEKLKKAYEFFNLKYPTTEQAVKEAFYNKQREIRENPQNQFTNIQLSKEYESILLNNLELKIQEHIEAFEETYESADEIFNILEKDRASFEDVNIMDDFVAWEEAVSINKIKEVSPKKKQQKRRKRRIKKATIVLLIVSVLIIIPITVTHILVRTGIYKSPNNNLVFQSLLSNGITLTQDYDQKIKVSEKNLDDISVNGRIVFPYKTKAMVLTDTIISQKIGVMECKSAIFFDDIDDTWEYDTQFTDGALLSHDLRGVWEGAYKVSKSSATISTFKIDIKDKVDNETYAGICTITAQNKKEGSYSALISINQENLTVSVTGLEWIKKPTFFIMEDLECVLDLQKEELSPLEEEGAVFSLTRQ